MIYVLASIQMVIHFHAKVMVGFCLDFNNGPKFIYCCVTLGFLN